MSASKIGRRIDKVTELVMEINSVGVRQIVDILPPTLLRYGYLPTYLHLPSRCFPQLVSISLGQTFQPHLLSQASVGPSTRTFVASKTPQVGRVDDATIVGQQFTYYRRSKTQVHCIESRTYHRSNSFDDWILSRS